MLTLKLSHDDLQEFEKLETWLRKDGIIVLIISSLTKMAVPIRSHTDLICFRIFFNKCKYFQWQKKMRWPEHAAVGH